MSKEGDSILNSKYSKGIIAIHWISAILILTLFPLGKYMSDIPVAEKIIPIRIHAAIGFLVFLLTIGRSVLFFTSKRPEHLSTGSRINDFLAIAVQRSFYFLLLAIGISGSAIMIYGGYADALLSSTAIPELILPREEIIPLKIHSVLATILMLLAAMHIVGVIRFNILHKTNVIKRIS